MPEATLAQQLVRWQRQHGRHSLPWQRSRDPYRVWLSEIMLQQTQVSTVLGYYERFLAQFPDVHALAAAPADAVLALWAGLGYYSRARNLHRCAQVVVQQHGGQFPRTAEQLATLPGIGRSTAAAIAAFCFDQRVAILDGNVKRVLGRVLAWDDDLAVARHERALWDRAQSLLPPQAEDMAAYTQGLMDLGATVCLRRQPHCAACPLHDLCQARTQGQPEAYPVRSRRLKRGQRGHALLWLCRGDAVWLLRRPDHGVWAGLWTLPEFDDVAALTQACTGWPGQAQALPAFVHVLTHLDLHLHPVRHQLPTHSPADGPWHQLWPSGRWVARADLDQHGLPAPVRKLLSGG